MNPLKMIKDELEGLLDENRQYEQRFRDLISGMDSEIHRLMSEASGSVNAVLKVEKYADWGRELELEVKTQTAETTHHARIVQIGRNAYQMTDDFDNETTVHDGAAALNTLLSWLTMRIKEHKGELAGGALTSRVIH